ncbi:putative binding domain of Nse4/EID3 to Nse3-MAGE [Lyophyllum shimeji]|uniref:Non-structural maintenance of chromosomes element 4 n=1 Tax=Lyophyllum shimeji TaxID=47721 RepID=A0A9P3PJU9_LYOSH|nr:putative binding domain of Nse4/EID3 to Nse3-MAGE [Lyophyllum shimeji]
MSDIEIEDPSASNWTYDPDQDPEEKRAVRKNYRSLAKTVEEQQAHPNDYTAEQLMKQVQQADSLFDKVKGPQEATLDSHFLLMASSMGAQKARAMKSGSGAFDVDEFVAKLITFMGGGKSFEDRAEDNYDAGDVDDTAVSLEWAKIGRKALAKSRRVPVMGFMLGPLSIEQKKRAASKRATIEKNKEELRKPQELKEADISRSQNETTKNVAVLENILNNIGEPINIFKFVINPNDFAQSVENIFYLSFLIRDGKVAFETTKDGEPVVFTCEQPTDQDYAGGLMKRQKVFEFDMAIWKRAIEVFDITKSTIPQRPPARTKLGDKWYG